MSTTSAPSTPLMPVADGLGPSAVNNDLLTSIGYQPMEKRSSTSILVDHSFNTMVSETDDVVIMPLAEAIVSYPWVQDLMFSLIDPDEDSTLRRAFESTRDPYGTFTWVKEGAHVVNPSQSFTLMTVPQERQFVHDITVIGKNATVDFVSGSGVAPELKRGKHVSISESFIGDGAHVRSISVERWGREMEVRSYDRSKIGENAATTSVSVAVSGLKEHWSSSYTEVGAGSACSSHSIVFSPTGTVRDMKSVIELVGPGAQAEQVSRMVSDGGIIRNNNMLKGVAEDVSGFLQCDGLMLQDAGQIESVPSLDAVTSRAQLSHEASVGMIDDEKLDYLKSLGLDEDAARDLIVQGFLNLDDDSIPASIRETVENLVAAARSGAM